MADLLPCFMWPSGHSNTFQSAGALRRARLALSEAQEVILDSADDEQVITSRGWSSTPEDNSPSYGVWA